MSDLYIDRHVSKAALNHFVAQFTPNEDEFHTFALYQKDTCLVRIAVDPYKITDKREIYSLSKSFASTCIGILVTDGVISVEDRIVDLFADDCPEVVSENLAKMKLRHVLSMNSGHAECVMPKMSHAENPVKAFLNEKVVYEPGTHFTYNTGATCLLGCLVTKLTGMSLLDFATERLFMPLGIDNIRWGATDSGISESGCGIHVTVDDIIKLGQLYYNGGVWNGKRILSEAWIKEATSPISDNSNNGTPDWQAGYGFQFWVNAREGFRGDGAFGQLLVVLPKHEMIVAIQTEVNDMQVELNRIYELADHIFDADDCREIILPQFSPISSTEKSAPIANRMWKFDANPAGFTTVWLAYHAEDDAMHVNLSDGVDQFTIRAGNGSWIENRMIAKYFKPKLVDIMSTVNKEECRFAASYAIENGVVHLYLRYLNCPHRIQMEFIPNGNGLKMKFTPDNLYNEGMKEISAH